jgi:DNA-directed RNA polymerase alpha subunit
MKASNLSLETPISNVFGMASVRTTNVFSELMLRTVGDLCQLGRKKLLATRNFGQRSMQEVDQMLAAHNLPPLV